ncbi:MAG TPA: DUF5071 domain-containing protein [Pyrinomonadaceae bacterium]|jgi:hypothetical protein|nr:DUF5071 domain-containing protein [Pyrinomonadaceae bacterium]
MPPEIYAGLPWDELPPELRQALPEDKSDTARAQEAARLGYPEVVPILPHLMRWLQDRNWPVAEVIAPFLSRVGEPLLPEIRNVLRGDDEVWTYWVLTELVQQMPDAAVGELRSELESLAGRPSEEEVDVLARELLTRA